MGLFVVLLWVPLLTPRARDDAGEHACIIPSCLDREVQLNGHLLQMVDDETLPVLHEMALAPGSTLGLPAFSYGFYVIRNAKAIACI